MKHNPCKAAADVKPIKLLDLKKWLNTNLENKQPCKRENSLIKEENLKARNLEIGHNVLILTAKVATELWCSLHFSTKRDMQMHIDFS